MSLETLIVLYTTATLKFLELSEANFQTALSLNLADLGKIHHLLAYFIPHELISLILSLLRSLKSLYCFILVFPFQFTGGAFL